MHQGQHQQQHRFGSKNKAIRTIGALAIRSSLEQSRTSFVVPMRLEHQRHCSTSTVTSRLSFFDTSFEHAQSQLCARGGGLLTSTCCHGKEAPGIISTNDLRDPEKCHAAARRCRSPALPSTRRRPRPSLRRHEHWACAGSGMAGMRESATAVCR